MKLKTSNDRLLKLADFLQKLPTGRFAYTTWVGYNWKGKQNLSCGTTACALGWAATMKPFRKLGLSLKHSSVNPYSGCFKEAYVSCKSVPPSNSGLDTSLMAAQEVFGIDNTEAHWLFVPSYPVNGRHSPPGSATAKEVAKHIRDFVASRKES